MGEITTTPLKKTNLGVIFSGRHDLPSYERTFSLTSFEMLNSFAAKPKGFRLFKVLDLHNYKRFPYCP